MKKFEQDRDALRDSVLEMGQTALGMVESAIAAYRDGETGDIKQVYVSENALDQMEIDIDHESARLLTVYSPVASDLRLILSVDRITQELERVGDQVVNMCEYLDLATSNDSSVSRLIEKMATLVHEMLEESLSAFRERDADKAIVVIRSDSRVDALNDQVLHEMLKSNAGEGVIPNALSSILIARSLERIADQATNICEAVVYMTRGADIRHMEFTTDNSGQASTN